MSAGIARQPRLELRPQRRVGGGAQDLQIAFLEHGAVVAGAARRLLAGRIPVHMRGARRQREAKTRQRRRHGVEIGDEQTDMVEKDLARHRNEAVR